MSTPPAAPYNDEAVELWAAPFLLSKEKAALVARHFVPRRDFDALQSSRDVLAARARDLLEYCEESYMPTAVRAGMAARCNALRAALAAPRDEKPYVPTVGNVVVVGRDEWIVMDAGRYHERATAYLCDSLKYEKTSRLFFSREMRYLRPATPAELKAHGLEEKPATPEGTFECPLCGDCEPHDHSVEHGHDPILQYFDKQPESRQRNSLTLWYGQQRDNYREQIRLLRAAHGLDEKPAPRSLGDETDVARIREKREKPAPKPDEGQLDSKFTCPRCGSHEWGTSKCNEAFSEWVGRCHGINCKFTWNRESEDRLYGLCYGPQPADAPAPAKGVVEAIDALESACVVLGEKWSTDRNEVVKADRVALRAAVKAAIDDAVEVVLDATKASVAEAARVYREREGALCMEVFFEQIVERVAAAVRATGGAR